MADNVVVTAGAGTTIAADEVSDGTLGSVKVQFVKIMDGTLDGTSKATVNATGLKVDASGAAVPVTDNSGSLTVDNGGTFATQSAQSGTWTVQPGNTPNTSPWLVTVTPGTTGGWSPSLQNALSTSVATVKGSAGVFGGYYIYNPNSLVSYVQIFDISGAVSLGSSTPKLSFGIPATSGANVEMGNGVNFANAIKVAATTTATGSTAPSTALDCNFYFK